MTTTCLLPQRRMRRILIVAFFIFFALSANGSATDKAPERAGKIAVLPFTVHGGEQYQYLKHAIPEMLASRISAAPGFRPAYSLVSHSAIKALEIDPAGLDPEKAAASGKQAGADFVIYGSLTVVGEGWSLDTAILEVGPKSAAGSFSRSGEAVDALIPGIDAMAADMAASLMPEKAEDLPRAPIAGFEVAEPLRRDLPRAWAGPEMRHNFTGLAAGDVTGDGLTEMVLVDADAVYVYRVEGRDFRLLKKIDAPSNTACIAVDVADINGSGRAEIFVTAKNNQGNMLRSFVLEYRDGEYRTIVEKSPWFYRVGHDPGTGPYLLGQRHQVESEPFQAEILRLMPKEGDYLPGEVFVPQNRGVNLLGVAAGPVSKEPGALFKGAAYDNQDRLQVLGADGKTLWTSRRPYGGSTLFMSGPRRGQGDLHDRYYLPGRLIIYHGPDESAGIFTFRNAGLAPSGFGRIRAYKDGEVLSLSWDGNELREQWKTREYDGHFRDLCVADLTNDGNAELAVLLIRSEGLILFSRPKAQVLIFPLYN